MDREGDHVNPSSPLTRSREKGEVSVSVSSDSQRGTETKTGTQRERETDNQTNRQPRQTSIYTDKWGDDGRPSFLLTLSRGRGGLTQRPRQEQRERETDN